MKRAWLLIPLAIAAASCSSDRYVGERFRAERDLWRADWEYRNFSILPEQVSAERWLSLAREYEAIAERNVNPKGGGAAPEVCRAIETIAAQAFFAAARVHGILQDSTRMETIYARMAADFGHLPGVAAEVAMARGSIAEARGDLLGAAELYEAVVARVAPDPGSASVAGVVLDLPLRIARLRAHGQSTEPAGGFFGAARAYYHQLVQEHSGETIELEAQGRLSEIAAELGEWDLAIEILDQLEQQLLARADPPREPCDVRFAIASIQARANQDLERAQATMLALLTDYPECELAVRVLMTLADNANRRHEVEEALGYLDRIVEEFQDDALAASEALLARGRLLEGRDRWPEALEALRSVAAQYPITEAALWAPLDIARHYARVEDEEAMGTALDQAERKYHEFISKYPPSEITLFARERLVQSLALQQKFGLAVSEMELLGRELTNTPKGASILIAAARMACADLADTARAAAILDQTGQFYANADIGKWASHEAARLRGTLVR